MPRMLHHDKMVSLFIKAINGGAERLSICSADWNIAGNCRDPYRTEVMGRPRTHAASGSPWRADKYFRFDARGPMPLFLVIHTRCRKCEGCRKARAWEWQFRTTEELRRAARSWFGTLTLSPESHYRMMALARHEAHIRSVPWQGLSSEERFQRIANTSLKEVTKYIKRVRKQAKVPLRYILVTETHRSGLPHFHMLVHEVEFKPVTHKILSSQWTLGFEKWRLVDFSIKPQASARYVTKYISKESQGRIRCSNLYGKSIGISGNVLTAYKNATSVVA